MSAQSQVPNLRSQIRDADVVVIGAGAVGCFVARELARYRLRVVLLERGADVCSGASKGNGAAIHSGVDPQPGTLKARLNILGSRAFPGIAEELDFPYRRCGALVVARTRDEIPALRERLARAKANGVEGVRILSRAELRRLEPNVAGVAALHTPSTAIVDPHHMVRAVAENAVANGVRLLLETPVTGMVVQRGRVRAVRTPRGLIRTRFVVNAAGVHADEIAAMAGVPDFVIHPRRGEYYVLDKFPDLISHIIFPVPTAVSKGICVVPTIHGNVLIGPNAEEISDKDATLTTATAVEELFRTARSLVPSVPLDRVIGAFSGIRPISSTGEFVIGPTAVHGFLNAAGTQSPGLSAAPAIARMIVDEIHEMARLTPKRTFNPVRKAPVRLAELPLRHRAKWVAKDPRYGHIVCRCEVVSEKEIMDAIHPPYGGLGACTLDALKHRTRAGMGRCQGGFCLPRVAGILSRELGVPVERLTKHGGQSWLFTGRTDGGGRHSVLGVRRPSGRTRTPKGVLPKSEIADSACSCRLQRFSPLSRPMAQA